LDVPAAGKFVFGGKWGEIENLFEPAAGWRTPDDFWGEPDVVKVQKTLAGHRYPIYKYADANFDVGRFVDVKAAGTQTWEPLIHQTGMFRVWSTWSMSVLPRQVNTLIGPLKCDDEVSIQIGCRGQSARLAWRQVLKVK
jgi:hypothetical protein